MHALRRLALPVLTVTLLALSGCPRTASGEHATSTVQTASTTTAASAYDIPAGENADPTNPLDKGWFTFSSVVDGDTIWVTPLQESLRLLCIDSEETVKNADDRAESGLEYVDWDATVAAARATEFRETKLILRNSADAAKARAQFDAFATRMRGTSDRPVKYGTPYGNLATEYAKWFFEAADGWDGAADDNVKIRLEIDDPKRQVDIYGRYLVYTFVMGPDGTELNFHVEQVRMGMSPYFPKYGHSVKYRQEFEAAQAEAQAAKRGIWSADWGHYPDYPERLAWWAVRGDTLSHFAENYGQNPQYFDLSSPSELIRLREAIGETVVVYGLIDHIRGRSDPATITLSTGEDSIKFPLDTTNPIAIAVEEKRWAEHYVYARGEISDKNGSLHMAVTQDADVWVEPAYLAELYLQGTSADKGEKEMATDVPGAQAASDPVGRPKRSSGKQVTTDPVTGLKVIPWDLAGDYENQGEVIVEGEVYAAKIVGKVAFINFDNDFKTTFSVFIPPTSVGKFHNQFPNFPDSLVGSTIRCRGTIIHYAKNDQDKPEIIAEDPAQLWIVE